VAHPAFARSEHPVRAERARGSAFRSSARTTNEVRGTGSRRGFARRNDGANLHLSWSGPRKGTPLRRRDLRGSSARAVPARGRTKVKAEKGSSPCSAERGNEAARGRCPCIARIAEVGRTPSGSEKRATFGGRVESLVAIPERVNGSLTIGGRSGAQAQGPTCGKRGADHRSSAILIT
jgi:hypothetical protein